MIVKKMTIIFIPAPQPAHLNDNNNNKNNDDVATLH